MSEKIYLVKSENEEGYEELNESKLKAYIEKETGVSDIEMESDEGVETYSADEIIEGVIGMVNSGSELNEGYPDEVGTVYNFVKEVMTESKKIKEEIKEKAKEAKEAKKLAAAKEKEEAEKKKEELAKRQDKLFRFIKKGADKAAKAFEGELTRFSKGLPDGITITENKAHKGFGISIDEGVTESNMAIATGYLLQQSSNSESMARTSGFLFGDLCNHFVRIDLFPSRIQAAAFISKKAEEEGKKIGQRGIESYARMAERTPLEFRNKDVVDKAYLTLANAKKPKQGEGEDKDSFNKRLKEHESDRIEIAEKLAKGEIVEVKDVSNLVNEMQIKHGLKEKKDPAAKTVSDHLKAFFLGTVCLDHLVGVHEDDEIHFQEKGSKDVLGYDKSDIAEMVENAKLNLVNALFSYKLKGTEVTLNDLIEGKAAFEVPKMGVEGKPTGKTKIVEKKVYPRPFFDIPKEEKADKETASEEEE